MCRLTRFIRREGKGVVEICVTSQNVEIGHHFGSVCQLMMNELDGEKILIMDMQHKLTQIEHSIMQNHTECTLKIMLNQELSTSFHSE